MRRKTSITQLVAIAIISLSACDTPTVPNVLSPASGDVIRPVLLTDAVPRAGELFPEYLTKTERGCSFPAISNPVILDEQSLDWYSSQLAAANEQPLQELAGVAPERLHVRFLWLRTFDNPIVVRIHEQEAGGAIIEAKRLSGAGGYEPGEIVDILQRNLTRSEFRRFNSLLSEGDLSNEPAANCDMGSDGAQWILEVVADGQYSYFERWTPQEGGVRDVALRMLDLTAWDIEPLY